MKYEVNFYYHTYCSFEIDAENEEDAISKARTLLDSEECDNELLANLQEEDYDTTVIED